MSEDSNQDEAKAAEEGESQPVGSEVEASDEAAPVGSEVDTEDEKAEEKAEEASDAGEDGARDVLASLDLTRGEIDDRDVQGLADAVDAIDFATRRATEGHLSMLRALHSRLGEVIEQIARGERAALPDRDPLTPEQEKRYESLVDEGLEAGRNRQLDVALRCLEEAVRIHPDGIDGLFNLGVVYGLVAHKNITTAEFYDDYTRDEIYVEKATICYDHVLDLEANHLPSLNNLATLCSMRDDKESAIGYLERIVASDPQTDVERHIVAEAKEQLSELR